MIFGLVNAVLKPIIKVVGCGFYILTLGLISFVVNALLFLLVGWLADELELAFVVDGFWAGFWGAIIVAHRELRPQRGHPGQVRQALTVLSQEFGRVVLCRQLVSIRVSRRARLFGRRSGLALCVCR